MSHALGGQKRGSESGVTVGHWEPNLGSLHEHQVFLPAKSSLQPHAFLNSLRTSCWLVIHHLTSLPPKVTPIKHHFYFLSSFHSVFTCTLPTVSTRSLPSFDLLGIKSSHACTQARMHTLSVKVVQSPLLWACSLVFLCPLGPQLE